MSKVIIRNASFENLPDVMQDIFNELHIDIKDKKRGGNVRFYDTTGCGDCFAAGFVAGLACNMNFRSCAEAGNETGQNRMSNGRKVYSILDKNV